MRQSYCLFDMGFYAFSPTVSHFSGWVGQATDFGQTLRVVIGGSRPPTSRLQPPTQMWRCKMALRMTSYSQPRSMHSLVQNYVTYKIISPQPEFDYRITQSLRRNKQCPTPHLCKYHDQSILPIIHSSYHLLFTIIQTKELSNSYIKSPKPGGDTSQHVGGQIVSDTYL